MDKYDIGIIGAGVAGSFAAFKIAQDHKKCKTILFDLGRPPMKRRRQLEGWLGCLPSSDGKLYLNDIQNVSNLTNAEVSQHAFQQFKKLVSSVDDFKTIHDRSPLVNMNKKIKKFGYDISLNDHIQIFPKNIHALSKSMSEVVDEAKNIDFSFDDEVKKIIKKDNVFHIITESKEYLCNKVIIAVGRSGWRWARDLYNDFDIVEDNNIAKFGIKIEISSSYMKDFNRSNCSLTKNNIEIGPLSWFGTVIPEDHVDMAISSFRSNENRWKTDKVSFSLIGNIKFENKGFEQTDRLGKLTFVLANDRIIKEKVSLILAEKSKISIIPEYQWLKEAINDISSLVPEISSKAYFHIPTIIPMAPHINISSQLETDIPGMFAAGESAGVHGIVAAA
jgi:uncharacterized FAD-dependent dehydrogenase